MNIISFNLDLNTQTQEETFSRIRFNNILEIYMNEKLTFCYHILVRNCSNQCKV